MNGYGGKASVETGFLASVGAVKLSANPYGFPVNKWLLYSESTNNNIPIGEPERFSFRLRDYPMKDKKIYFGVKKPVVYNQNNKARAEEIQQYIIARKEIEKRVPVINYEYWSTYLNSI
jgi:hypothetical protein